MKAPTWLVTVLQLFLSLSIPIILIISPLYLFFTPAMVRYEYSRAGFPPATRFDRQERLRLSDTIVRYVRGRESVESLRRIRTDEGGKALRESEIQHLVDVKKVLDGLFMAYRVALIVGLVAGVALLWLVGSAYLIKGIQNGVWITAGCMALVLVSAFVDFGTFFTRFHQMFFESGTWVFDAQDTLIQLYPLTFWVDVVWKLGAFIVAEVGLLYTFVMFARYVIGENG